MTPRRIPDPQAQAFVACRKITNDPPKGELALVGPVSHWRALSSGSKPVPPWEWRAIEKRR
jgi:hypothetical protein